MIFKEMKYSSALKNVSNEIKETAWKGKWEEVPQEDLWEDGEISNNTCMIKIYNNVVESEWKLIREIK